MVVLRISVKKQGIFIWDKYDNNLVNNAVTLYVLAEMDIISLIPKPI